MSLTSIHTKSWVRQVSIREYRDQYQHLYKIIHADQAACQSHEDHFHNVQRALDASKELSQMYCPDASMDDFSNIHRVLELSARYVQNVTNGFKVPQVGVQS